MSDMGAREGTQQGQRPEAGMSSVCPGAPAKELEDRMGDSCCSQDSYKVHRL